MATKQATMEELRVNEQPELDSEVTEEGQDGQEGQGGQNGQEQQQSEKKVISGYALKFNEPSKDLGGFTEVITPEALKEVDFSNVYLLYNHDYSKPLASTKAETLKLEVDEVGLKFEAELPNTSYANDVYENVSSNIIDSMSFGFEMELDSFTENDNGEVTRSIDKMKSLNEISVVTIPAYDDSVVQVDKRSYKQFMNKANQKGESKNMDKNLLNNEQTEIRGYEDYIRSKGEERDGVTTENASAVVPSEVIKEVFDLKRADYNLAQYVTVKDVSNGQGQYPIATDQQATLLTKEELAEIGDVDADMFTQVDYKVETRAGKIALSNEVVEDSEVDIVKEVKDQLNKLVDNTDNQHIIDLLKTFTSKSVSTLDELKQINNVDLDPALNKTVLLNQSAFNHLDTLKDNDGRYILQPDITAQSGKSLFGLPIVVISDKLLPNEGSDFPVIIGDLKQAVFVARRNQITTQWEKFDHYSQGLAVIVRNDYEKIDEDSAVYIKLSNETAGTEGA